MVLVVGSFDFLSLPFEVWAIVFCLRGDFIEAKFKVRSFGTLYWVVSGICMLTCFISSSGSWSSILFWIFWTRLISGFLRLTVSTNSEPKVERNSRWVNWCWELFFSTSFSSNWDRFSLSLIWLSPSRAFYLKSCIFCLILTFKVGDTTRSEPFLRNEPPPYWASASNFVDLRDCSRLWSIGLIPWN